MQLAVRISRLIAQVTSQSAEPVPLILRPAGQGPAPRLQGQITTRLLAAPIAVMLADQRQAGSVPTHSVDWRLR